MGAAFSHFTENERFTLEKLRKEGFSFGHIANILGKSKSSISREYNRNQVEQFKNGKYQMVYCHKAATNISNVRRANSKKNVPRCFIKEPYMVKFVNKYLAENKSLYWIYYRGKRLFKRFFSLKTLYALAREGIFELPKYYKTTFKLYGKHKTVVKFEHDKRDIEYKKLYCYQIEDFNKDNYNLNGVWQVDLFEGKAHKEYTFIAKNVDSGVIFLEYLENKKAETVNKTFSKFLNYYPVEAIITDNGSEFHKLYLFSNAYPDRLEKSIDIYYTHTFAPLEKRDVEYTISEIRRNYGIKKGIAFPPNWGTLCKLVQLDYNNCEKVQLNFLSPNMLYYKYNGLWEK